MASDGSIAAKVIAAAGTVTVLRAAVPDGHGATVEIAAGLTPPVRRARAGPPNRPQSVYGRDQALFALDAAITAKTPLVVAGELGAGKTTVVDAAMNGSAAATVDHGIVQIPGALGGLALTVDEIAQRLFDALWDTSPHHRRIDAASAPSELIGCHPLLVVDGLQLRPDEQDAVARLIPGSPVLFTADAAPLGGGEFVEVGGLPRTDAVRLLTERSRSGVGASPELLARAAELLQDWPGALATLADLIRTGRVTFDAAVSRMEAAVLSGSATPAVAYERLLAVIDGSVSRSELDLLETIAGLAGASVRDDVAQQVAGVPATTADGLLASGLVWRASPRLQMDQGLRVALRRSGSHEGTQVALERLASMPDMLLDKQGDLDPLDVPDAVLALRIAHRASSHASVARLARALDPWLFANRLWDARRAILDIAGTSGRDAGDVVLEGWAAHELGTDAFLRGRFEDADGYLRRAVELRAETDPRSLARSSDVLETLRIVAKPPLLPWWRQLGPRGPMVAVIVGIVVVGTILWTSGVANALQGILFGPTPTASPTVPVTPPPTREPVTPSPGPSVEALGVDVGQVTDAVFKRTGEWTGRVTVTPSGGVPPYTYELNVGARRADGPEVFDVSGTDCGPAVVSGRVTDEAGERFEVKESRLPAACVDRVAPSAPTLLSPSDASVLFLNCRSWPIEFTWSAGSGDAVAWSIEVDQFQDAWLPVVRQADIAAPTFSEDVPCATSIQWRVAGVSDTGLQGDWSEPWSFLIQPTDIPVLNHPDVAASCVSTQALSWTVGRPDGIGGYEVRVTDGSTGQTTTITTTEPTYDLPITSCAADYVWTVSTIDLAGGRGDPSTPDAFYMPTPVS